MTVMRTLIVDGSPEPSSPALAARLAEDADYIVAVDRGAMVCHAAGVVPDLFVGDEDSADPAAVAWAKSVARGDLWLPVEKDGTDLFHAIAAVRAEAARRGAVVDLTLTCVTGGRPDHALAIYGLLAANRDLCPTVIEDGFELAILSPEGIDSWEFAADEMGKTFSAIALAPGTVISEQGMRWELDGKVMAVLDDLGVSNIIVAEDAKVTCHEGCLAAFLLNASH